MGLLTLWWTGYVYMLECASNVQPNLFHLSDKHPHCCGALGLVPVKVRTGPAALRLLSLLKVSGMYREQKIVSFLFFPFNSLFSSSHTWVLYVSCDFCYYLRHSFRFNLNKNTLLSSLPNSGGEFFMSRGPFYLIYVHNHSKSPTVMLTFQREVAPQLLLARWNRKECLHKAHFQGSAFDWK